MLFPFGRTAGGTPVVRRALGTLLAFALMLTGMVGLGAASSVAEEAPAGPTIASDQADYAPGATVVLTGAGWQAQEPVHITVNDDQGRTWQRDVDVVADDAGAISDSFNLPNWFVATYAVTATGAVSGVVTSGFTDSNLKVATLATSGGTIQSVSANVSYGKYANASGCGTTTPNSVTAVSGGTTIQGGVGAGDYVLLTAPPTVADADGSHTFQGWSVEGETDSGAGVLTRCVAGVSGSKTATARYSLGVPSTTSTTTAVVSSANPSTYGSPVTFTATVTPSPAGAGAVTFTDGPTVLCSAVAVTGATASCATSALAAGAHTVTASYAGATGFNTSTGSLTENISPKQVTGFFSAADKVYDGNTSASITGRSLTGVLTADIANVSLSGGTASFGTATVGTGKTVTGTGFSLTGSAVSNYTLASTTLTTTASIGQHGVTVGFTSPDKVYDRTTAAGISAATVTAGLVGNDSLTVSGGTASFATASVGTDKTVQATGFTLVGAAKDNYVITSVNPAKASITRRPVTGAIVAADKTYDGSDLASTTDRSLTGVLGPDQVTLTGTPRFDNANVGTGKIVTLTGAGLGGADAANYTLGNVPTDTADISAKALTVSFAPYGKTYDGTASAAVSDVTLHGAVAGDEVAFGYATARFADKNAGSHKPVSLTSGALSGAQAGNYSFTVDDEYADIAALEVTGSFSVAPREYDGTTDALVATPEVVGRMSGDDVSLSVKGATFGSKNVGDPRTVTGTLSLTGADAGNYVLASTTGSTTSAIRARRITGTFTAEDKVYDATTDATVLTRGLDNTVSGDDVRLTDGTASFADAAVGESKVVTLTGATLGGADAGNYILDSVHTTTANIGTRALEITADPQSKVYGEGDPILTYTITKGELKGTDRLTGALSRETGEDVGTYAITQGSLGADANYALSFVSKDLKVTPKRLTVTTIDADKTYGEPNPDFSVDYDGFVHGDDEGDLGGSLSYTTIADTSSPVGSYDVTPSGLTSDNYAITFVEGTLKVTPRDLTVTAANRVKTYGDALALGTSAFSTIGLVNGDTVASVTLHSDGAAASAPVATYAVVPSGAVAGEHTDLGNYAVHYVNGALSVAKAPLTITVDDKSRVYGDANPTLTGTVAGVKNSDPVSASYSTSATVASGVGTYAIVPAAVGDAGVLANYAITLTPGTLSVTPRALSITAKDQEKTYGQTLDLGSMKFDVVGLANDDSVVAVTLTSPGAAAAADTGGYDIVVSGAVAAPRTSLGNYEVSYHMGALTVKKAPLTVTTKPATKVYGDANPSFAVSYDGFVLGQTQSVLGGSLAYTTTADTSSPVGSYDVTPSGLTSDNYAITFVKGTLSVTKAPLTVTADNQTKTLGSANPTLSGVISGVKNGDSVVATYSTTADANSPVGPYPIVPSVASTPGAVLANYDVTLVNGKLTVVFVWDGFLQPINDTAHQVGTVESKFKLGQTIPVKFQLKNAAGASVQQTGSPTFSVSGNLGACDSNATLDTTESVTATNTNTFAWDGSKYQYNWSTKGIASSGEYRINAALADGTKQSVYICLTK